MDLCRNITVSGGLASQYQPEQLFSSCSKLGTDSLDDLFSSHYTTETDVGLDWLSIYVEDCFSGSGSCLLPAAPTAEARKTTTLVTPKPELQQINTGTTSLHDSVIPGKARSKRKRSPLIPKLKNRVTSSWCSCDPPLLHQAYWLADSELILPKKDETHNIGEADQGEKGGKKKTIKMEMQGRRCSHCLAQRTPQWRAGPMGPKTLCNACGVRYKSGRLLPEYRPAKSPTFVSYKHSNSHKKVLEIRMALQFSSLSAPQL